MEEDEERKIHDIQIKYEKKLHTEKETNTNLRGETGIMTQKVTCWYSLKFESMLLLIAKKKHIYLRLSLI